MADDLLNLGTTLVFPLIPNWAVTPSSSFVFSRRILSHPGTVQVMKSITDDVPINFDAGFTLYDKEEEHSVVEFFHDRKGKVQRFWLFHPKNAFVLKDDATSGSVTLVCQPNRAYSSYQGYERIYIKMNDGDTITRQVEQVTYSEVTGDMSVLLSEATDRDITTTNHYMIGRVLLVRFDSDEFDLDIVTDCVSEIRLRFYELVKEYDLI